MNPIIAATIKEGYNAAKAGKKIEDNPHLAKYRRNDSVRNMMRLQEWNEGWYSYAN